MMFLCCVAVYFAGMLIIILRGSKSTRRFESYLQHKHPHRLREFELPLTIGSGKSRHLITLFLHHEFDDPELHRLFRKTRGYYILLFSWLLLAFPFFVFATILDHVFKTAL